MRGRNNIPDIFSVKLEYQKAILYMMSRTINTTLQDLPIDLVVSILVSFVLVIGHVWSVVQSRRRLSEPVLSEISDSWRWEHHFLVEDSVVIS